VVVVLQQAMQMMANPEMQTMMSTMLQQNPGLLQMVRAFVCVQFFYSFGMK
jgi:hypothetical protein